MTDSTVSSVCTPPGSTPTRVPQFPPLAERSVLAQSDLLSSASGAFASSLRLHHTLTTVHRRSGAATGNSFPFYPCSNAVLIASQLHSVVPVAAAAVVGASVDVAVASHDVALYGLSGSVLDLPAVGAAGYAAASATPTASAEVPQAATPTVRSSLTARQAVPAEGETARDATKRDFLNPTFCCGREAVDCGGSAKQKKVLLAQATSHAAVAATTCPSLTTATASAAVERFRSAAATAASLSCLSQGAAAVERTRRGFRLFSAAEKTTSAERFTAQRLNAAVDTPVSTALAFFPAAGAIAEARKKDCFLSVSSPSPWSSSASTASERESREASSSSSPAVMTRGERSSNTSSSRKTQQDGSPWGNSEAFFFPAFPVHRCLGVSIWDVESGEKVCLGKYEESAGLLLLTPEKLMRLVVAFRSPFFDGLILRAFLPAAHAASQNAARRQLPTAAAQQQQQRHNMPQPNAAAAGAVHTVATAATTPTAVANRSSSQVASRGLSITTPTGTEAAASPLLREKDVGKEEAGAVSADFAVSAELQQKNSTHAHAPHQAAGEQRGSSASRRGLHSGGRETAPTETIESNVGVVGGGEREGSPVGPIEKSDQQLQQRERDTVGTVGAAHAAPPPPVAVVEAGTGIADESGNRGDLRERPELLQTSKTTVERNSGESGRRRKSPPEGMKILEGVLTSSDELLHALTQQQQHQSSQQHRISSLQGQWLQFQRPHPDADFKLCVGESYWLAMKIPLQACNPFLWNKHEVVVDLVEPHQTADKTSHPQQPPSSRRNAEKIESRGGTRVFHESSGQPQAAAAAAEKASNSSRAETAATAGDQEIQTSEGEEHEKPRTVSEWLGHKVYDRMQRVAESAPAALSGAAKRITSSLPRTTEETEELRKKWSETSTKAVHAVSTSAKELASSCRQMAADLWTYFSEGGGNGSSSNGGKA